MTVARELAEFLTRTSSSDLPRQAVDHAAMLIVSTIASAAMGAGLESSEIIRTLARERGGSPEASVWFGFGPEIAGVRCRANGGVPEFRVRHAHPASPAICARWSPACRGF